MFLSQVHNIKPEDYFSSITDDSREMILEFAWTGEEVRIPFPEIDYDWWEGGYCSHVADVNPQICYHCYDCVYQADDGCDSECEYCHESEEDYQARDMENREKECGKCDSCAYSALEIEHEHQLWMVLNDNFSKEIWGK